MRVLVVDDHEDLRLLCRWRLEGDGLEVRVAEDGWQALAVLREWVPDVIVTDLGMPRMDGFELLGAVRSSARLSEVPVVVLTARRDVDDRELARMLGAAAVVPKGHGMLFDLERALGAVAAGAR